MYDFFTSTLISTTDPKKEFNRIFNGELISSSNIPYTILYYKSLIKTFEESEEYEKCDFLLKLINTKLDHDNNYLDLNSHI